MRRLDADDVGQLLTIAFFAYTYLDENPQARARIWLRIQKVCQWGAVKLGRAAMTAELAYRREVSS